MVGGVFLEIIPGCLSCGDFKNEICFGSMRWKARIESMKVTVKTGPGRFLLLDASEIYYIEAARDDVLLRTASKRRYRGVTRLPQWEKRLRAAGFLRIHRSFLVNLDRVREVRLRRGDPNDWEVKLDPPVNVVLPVGRAYLAALRKALKF
jgi:DNA-binding LytR/AlgR family response regulator